LASPLPPLQRLRRGSQLQRKATVENKSTSNYLEWLCVRHWLGRARGEASKGFSLAHSAAPAQLEPYCNSYRNYWQYYNMRYIMYYITTSIFNIIQYWQYQFISSCIWTITHILLYYYIVLYCFIFINI
jgi:hypothetical protein